ncbi:MAG: M20/M25/M40 family metallo-hydrolase [Acidobacteriota bacterium]
MQKVWAALIWFALAASLWAQSPVQRYREENAARILRDFAELLSIPNLASDTPNIRRNALYLRDAFARRGARMELLELDGAPPIVYGELMAPDADRTLILYVHYDGQPVDLSQWTNPPWEPTLYSGSLEDGAHKIDWPQKGDEIDPEWRIYARGAGDDKAPLPAILTALDALQAANIPLTSNLKFFFEGEEEAGSPHLGEYLKRYANRLQGDLWLFCDGPVHQSRRPQLVFGVRGVVSLEITVFGATRYLHSGHYGNWAPNPGMLLAELLASMKDEKGNVIVEGYYDSAVPLTAAEKQSLAKMPAFDDQLRAELGLAATENDNQPYMERLLIPSLNLRGLQSATVGPTARNIIPTKATASLDLRLVPGNDPQHMLDLVEAHIRAQGFYIVRQAPGRATRLAHPKIVQVVRGQGYPAARTRMDLPIARRIADAVERASGEGALMVPTLGGSLPLYLFTETLKRPVLIVPIANHDDNQHAPDENLRLANLWYGIDLMCEIFTMP